jgi:hypothetical protein
MFDRVSKDHFLSLVYFHHGAADLARACSRMVEAVGSNQPLPNDYLWDVVSRLIPQEPFHDEMNYPDESLFVGDSPPPPVADIFSATTHFGVYQLARETLAKVYRSTIEVIPSLANGLRGHIYWHFPTLITKIPPALVSLLKRVLWEGQREYGDEIAKGLNLVPINVEEVTRWLKVESLRSERMAKTRTSAFPPACEVQALARDHSPDFRMVRWDGNVYPFTPAQAAIVGILWQAWERKVPDVGNETLLAEARLDTKRVKDIFKKHPAWGKMIVQGTTKGSSRLGAPGAG